MNDDRGWDPPERTRSAIARIAGLDRAGVLGVDAAWRASVVASRGDILATATACIGDWNRRDNLILTVVPEYDRLHEPDEAFRAGLDAGAGAAIRAGFPDPDLAGLRLAWHGFHVAPYPHMAEPLAVLLDADPGPAYGAAVACAWAVFAIHGGLAAEHPWFITALETGTPDRETGR